MKRAASEQKRQAILDAAARAIARHGFHGMSMRGLAHETRQSLAAFYNHFSSKEEVLFHIQRIAFETMIASAQQALGGLASPQDRLFAFIHAHLAYLAGHADVMRVLIHEAGTLPGADRSKVRLLKERYYGLCREILEELCWGARDPVELERITYGVFGMLNWTYGWYEPGKHGSPAEVASTIHRLALRGLVQERNREGGRA
jgi:AcrR family transcriptional regulator